MAAPDDFFWTWTSMQVPSTAAPDALNDFASSPSSWIFSELTATSTGMHSERRADSPCEESVPDEQAAAVMATVSTAATSTAARRAR